MNVQRDRFIIIHHHPLFPTPGILGGLFGAAFNGFNEKLTHFRMKYVKSKALKSVVTVISLILDHIAWYHVRRLLHPLMHPYHFTRANRFLEVMAIASLSVSVAFILIFFSAVRLWVAGVGLLPLFTELNNRGPL
jgi:hypothetical protein